MTILYGFILYGPYRGVRKIKPFACERDFYVHEFIRMKHASRHLITLKSFEIIRLKHCMDRKRFKRMILKLLRKITLTSKISYFMDTSVCAMYGLALQYKSVLLVEDFLVQTTVD